MRTMADCQALWFTCLMMVSSPPARTCSLCLSKNKERYHAHQHVAEGIVHYLVFEGHNLRGTGQSTLAALQTVGMQIADGLAARVVGRELHRADAGALLALHLTGIRHVDIRECLGQWSLLRSYPVGDSSHGAKRTPCAWGIDEGERDTNDGSHDDNRPEHFAYTSPHGKSTLAPRHETQLNAEHAKDEKHHEQAEAKGAHELWNRTMG